MANNITITPGAATDMWCNFGVLNLYGRVNVGYNSVINGGAGGTIKGALRFQNVQIPKNSTGIDAYVKIYANERFGSSDIYVKIWGMDEDNTADFSSDPMGRTKTTAYNTTNSGVSTGGYLTVGVGSIVEEIVGRSGWSPGNSIGFIIEDNGTTTSESTYIYDEYTDPVDSYFDFRVGSEPNFNPTPKSVAAPTFPSAEDIGLKISYPGYSVFDATEDELYYTTRKRSHKIKEEDVFTSTAGVTYNIAHGLGYIPFAMVYVKEVGSTKRYKIPRYIPEDLYQDQFGSLDTTNGTVELDSTNLKITTTSNCEVYYRIFYDQI